MLKKINNNGWGTLEMCLISAALLIALLVSIFFISKLYGSFNNALSKDVYYDLEDNLEKVAQKYIDENNITILEEVIITNELLNNNGYHSILVDSTGQKCDGYVKVSITNDIKTYKGYISCANYRTDGYEK